MRVSTNSDNRTKSEKSEQPTKSKKRSSVTRGSGDDQAAEKPAAKEATDVKISAKAKEATPPAPPSSDKELTQAEHLMDHVNSGRLSKDEQDMAMKRVGDIVKKYGSNTGRA